MKKTLLLTLALGMAGASSLVAGTIDVYITGSTAFRANVYTACEKLYVGQNPTIYYADAAHGGANSGFSSKTASWVMTGTPATSLTNIQGNTLVIHGLFTGSIQGLKSTEQSQGLIWAQPVGTAGGNANTYITNAPTIGFSDCSGAATPYPAGNLLEEQVCVQPFAFFKSTAPSGPVTAISNVTWEQLEFGIPNGRIPLSAWDYNTADTNAFVYLMQRTADSGTRRTETQGAYYQFKDPVGIYLFDTTNFFFYPTNNTQIAAMQTTNTSLGGYPAGVIGTEGPGNGGANMVWGFGYIGGGDIANELNVANANNQAIAMLSMGDGKSVGSSSWNNVISYNGIWPTTDGPNIHGFPSGTNNYSPITLGYYPLWGFEVLVHPENTLTPGQTIPGQDITYGQLGDYLTPGSFMGVFNAQSLNNGFVTTGSIENEIKLSEPSGATAITLAEMGNTRPSVGGEIFPPIY